MMPEQMPTQENRDSSSKEPPAPNCLTCGQHHQGPCSPESFAILTCGECGWDWGLHPWDAVGMMSVGGTMVRGGCGHENPKVKVREATQKDLDDRRMK